MTQMAPMLEMMKAKMGKRRFGQMMQTMGPMMSRMMENGGGGFGGMPGGFGGGSGFAKACLGHGRRRTSWACSAAAVGHDEHDSAVDADGQFRRRPPYGHRRH